MIDENFYKTIENMRRYGGSFVQSLARCFEHADPINTERLKQAFPDIIWQYSNFKQKPPKKTA